MLMLGCFLMQNSEDIAEDFVGRNFARAGARTIVGGGAVSPRGHLLDFSSSMEVLNP